MRERHDHLILITHTDEEKRAAGCDCTVIPFSKGGPRTEAGRHLTTAGFQDGRGAVLFAVKGLREARAHLVQISA